MNEHLRLLQTKARNWYGRLGRTPDGRPRLVVWLLLLGVTVMAAATQSGLLDYLRGEL